MKKSKELPTSRIFSLKIEVKKSVLQILLNIIDIIMNRKYSKISGEKYPKTSK